MARGDENHQCNVRISEQGELLEIVGFLQAQDEAHEAAGVEQKGDHAMIGD